VQAYHPSALTLDEAYIQQRLPLNEETIWSHALQLIAAVHTVHLAGMAVRVIDMSHVLLTSKETVRLSCAGLLDVTRPDGTRTAQQHQLEDLLALGRLLVCLACASPTAATPQHLQKSMGYVQAAYSAEFNQLLMLLLTNGPPQPTIFDVVAFVSGRLMTRVSQTQWHVDALLTELSKECENGRLLRLLAKIAYVADRPELGMDTEWGASSDRHLIRLFRDSIFHQVDQSSAAVVDFAHVVGSLNRLDVGYESKTLLTSNSSRGNSELLLVSYKDVRTVLDSSFDEVVDSANHVHSAPPTQSQPPPMMPPQMMPPPH